MKSLFFLSIFLFTINLSAQVIGGVNNQLWKGMLSMNDRLEIPFLFDFSKVGKKYVMTIKNGNEGIELKCLQKNDSVTAFFPGIDSYIRFSLEKEEMRGYWINLNKKKIQKIPFLGTKDAGVRCGWTTNENPSDVIMPKYRIVFDDDKQKNTAVLIFSNELSTSSPRELQGTILTETGDYRYLAGCSNRNSFTMSTFNGIWALLVEGQIKGDSIKGNFYSGSSYRTGWRGKADDNAMLRKASSLTYVINDQAINFSSVRTLKGKSYRSKQNSTTKLYQIMGSWCPNCLDEIVFFKELHKEFAEDGLEIIAFAYENQQEISSALLKLKKFAKRMEIPYTICYAGSASKEEASETFPMLNEIISFPTSILVDRNGKIRYIHTGFSGPATGQVYEDYMKELRELIEKLLKE